MRYERCRCGKLEFWGSGMSPAPCSGCEDCGTTPASHPDGHKTPEPHEFVAHSVDTDAGAATLSRCRWCMKTRKQLERETVAHALRVPAVP
jgi:hypothetical protein